MNPEKIVLGAHVVWCFVVLFIATVAMGMKAFTGPPPPIIIELRNSPQEEAPAKPQAKPSMWVARSI